MSREVLAAVMARAFARARASDANSAIARIRAQEGGEGGEAWSYEVAVPADEPGRHLVEVVLPKLVYFLDCRGAKLPRAPGVFATLFVGDELYFVRASDLLEELGRASGLSPAEMVRRWGADSA